MTDEIQNFDEFIVWLEQDGLSAKKSKRLWRKKIFTNLINNESKTIENYKDFITEKKLKSLIGKIVHYKNIKETICNYQLTQTHYIFILCDSQNTIKAEHDLLDFFIQTCIQKN